MIKRYAVLAVMVLFLALMFSCYKGSEIRGQAHHQSSPVYKKQAPMPWAPAHGQQAKHIYRYYPAASIYYDTGRGLYYYYTDDSWTKSMSIPASMSINISGYVTLEMDIDKPYMHHDEVKKRYPES